MTTDNPLRRAATWMWLWACLVLWACAGSSSPPADSDPSQQPPEAGAILDPGSEELPESVATALMIAGAAAEAGDYEEALGYYGYALQRDPGNRQIGDRFVALALQTGQLREALAGVDLMLRSEPDDLALRLQKAHLLLLAGEVPTAATISEQLEAEAPDDPAVIELRVQVLESQGRLLEAAELQAKLIKMRPDDSSLALGRAALLLRADKSLEAERQLRAVLRVEPENEAAAELLVGHLSSQGKNDEAVELLEQLVEETPDSSVHRRVLADAYLSEGREEEAADLLLPLARRGELDWHSQILLTDLLVRVGRVDDAWELAQGLLRGSETDALVLHMVGEIALERGELQTAEELLERAWLQRQDDPNILVSLLLAISRRYPALVGDPPELDEGEAALNPGTEERFDQLLSEAMQRVQPDDFRQNLILGALLRRRGRSEEAVVHLSRAHQLRPENFQAALDLAWAQEEANLHRMACDTLDSLLALRPDEAHLLNFYGYLLAEQGWELERARGMIEQAVAAEPDNPYYLDSLGWVLYQMGDYEEALDHLITASNQLGDDATVLEHIGDTLMALDRYERAISIYERALEVGADPGTLQPRLEEARAKADSRP